MATKKEDERQIKERSKQVDFNRFNITGTVTRIYPPVTRSERFRKQEFSIRFTDINPFNNKVTERTVKFTLINDDIRLLDNVREEDQVEVLFYVDGRDYTKNDVVNNFTSLAAIGLVNLDDMEGLRNDIKPEERDPRDIFNRSVDDAFKKDSDVDIFSHNHNQKTKDEGIKTFKPGEEDGPNETEKEAMKEMDKALEDKPKELDEFDDLPF